MDLISHLLPSQTGLNLQRWDLDLTTQQVTVYLASTQVLALCPLCHRRSHRIHRHYERTLKDLPIVQFTLTIVLSVSKFFCLNDACPQRIFTERLPEVVAPWARRTLRYANHLTAMAIALDGAAGARLSEQMGYDHSRNSMLRVIEAVPLPAASTPRILGVDDFALRKGHHYGTILVDLEQRQPIALLPDRTAETLETWLKDHPGVEILSRDRSKTYKRGMSQGAPDAIQVADRFHLLHNLEETLETAFKGHNTVLKQVEKDHLQADGLVVLPSVDLPKDSQSPKALNRARRLEKYDQTHALRQQGYAIKAIAHHRGIGKRTVYKYLAATTFPERQPTIRQQGSGLDAYKPYIQDQWNRGQQQTKALFHEIQQHGYRGSYSPLARYTHQLRQLPTSDKPDSESLNRHLQKTNYATL
jgi:transposase